MAEPIKQAHLSSEKEPARPGGSAPATAHRWRVVTAVLLLATACALGFGLWILSLRLAPQITAPASAESAYVASFPEKSIAVLPFAELSEAQQHQPALAEAVQDDIINGLSKIADLRVISRTSVSSYAADKPRNLRAIAQSLGAGHLLEGSARRDGQKVRITVQLTDARRGTSLWIVNYERDLAHVFGMQGDLLEKISSQLHATISADEKTAIDEQPTHDLAAYALYIQGKTLISSVSSCSS
ncbi:MAG: hypothetical protein H0W66_06580 [Chthoniobacterales bacterium]|nr:hypothetical protein [Chthoniobacterales bacterium]